MEEKLRGEGQCKQCSIIKTHENTYIQNHEYGRRLSSYCKSCERKQHKKYLAKNMNKKKYQITKVWEKTNKNHYPDPEWVWSQLERNDVNLTEEIEKKYALKKHGNEGNQGNRWKNKKNK